MSDSVWPHRQQTTRLPCPWDSPSKNIGVGCHFLLQLLFLLPFIYISSCLIRKPIHKTGLFKNGSSQSIKFSLAISDCGHTNSSLRKISGERWMLQLKLTNSLCSFLMLFFKIPFLAALGLLLSLWSRGYSPAAPGAGLSLWRLLFLRSTGSRLRLPQLQPLGLSSCGTWAKLLLGTCDLPGPQIKLVSPAVADGFLTTGPPEKSTSLLNWHGNSFLLEDC